MIKVGQVRTVENPETHQEVNVRVEWVDREWSPRQVVVRPAVLKYDPELQRETYWAEGRAFFVHGEDVTDKNGYCPLHSGYEEGAEQCLNSHDHCKHGVYTGGCGIDWMCGKCEMGDE